MAAALEAFLASETHIDILDCGCGTGHWLIELASPGRHLIGMVLDKQRYLSGKAIRELLTTVGFVDGRTEIVQSLPSAASARRTLERGGAAKTVTSQLAILTDDEYQRGVQLIEGDIIDAEHRGQELLLLSDLRLYATTAWLR